MLSSIKRVLVSFIVKFLPETSCFAFKRFLYRSLGHKIGTNVRICSSVKILGNGLLIIGKNTWIGPNAIIISSSKITLGENIDIAPLVYIGTGTHNIMDVSNRVAGTGKNLEIKIGDGCWLGVRATILPGVELKKMSMVAAGSLVTKNFSEFKMIGGVPAKVIKDLKDYNVE